VQRTQRGGNVLDRDSHVWFDKTVATALFARIDRARTSKRVWFAGRVLLSLVLILVAFAAVIPNCIVPGSPSHAAYFAWSGLIGPCVVACLVVYCVWFWR
jgi:hypothetical protein